MGLGHGSSRVIDVGNNDASNEIMLYENGPATSGTTIRVYATSTGVKVGCTWVSREAFEKIAKIMKSV